VENVDVGTISIVIVGFCLATIIFHMAPIGWPLLRFLAWRIASRAESTCQYFQLEDCRIYYEVHGSGPTILLLHGGLTSVEAWFGQLPTLSQRFQVIAVDMRGHGRSTLGSQPFTYRLLANDVFQLIQSLSIDTAHVVGWSDGGNVGLILASQYPETVKSLVTMGANYHPDGLTQETIEDIRSTTHEQQSWVSRLLYFCVAPDPKTWKLLCHRVTTMWLNYPQLDIQTLTEICCPALILQGEYDSVELEHSKEMAAAIPNATLDVLPGLGHNLLFQAPNLLAHKIVNFLELAKQPLTQAGAITNSKKD
jgi:pimeloyl-ACP methyl ester carboxylesterase